MATFGLFSDRRHLPFDAVRDEPSCGLEDPITIPAASVAPRSSQRHGASIRGNIDAADLLRSGTIKSLTLSEWSG